jgi:hypothetical protein
MIEKPLLRVRAHAQATKPKTVDHVRSRPFSESLATGWVCAPQQATKGRQRAS